MDFEKGYSKKPKYIDDNNTVVFEQQTTKSGGGEDAYELTETTPNQDECEAYGYYWDAELDVCKATASNSQDPSLKNLLRKNMNISDKIYSGIELLGASNRAYTGVSNVKAIGEYNSFLGRNNNSLMSGSKNEMDWEVNNSTCIGTRGNASVSNQLVHGGSQAADISGERQYTRVIFGAQTTAGGVVATYLNNDGASLYPIPTDSIMYFNVSCLAVRVGGSNVSGDIGDYASWLERGVVISRDGTLEIKRTRKSMSSDGVVTDWRPTAVIDGTNFYIEFRGETDCIIEFSAVVDFTEIRTGVDLSTGR